MEPTTQKTWTVDEDLRLQTEAYMARRGEDYAKSGKTYGNAQLAVETGVTSTYISRYLSAKPNFNPDKLERVLRSLLNHEARRRALVHGLFPTEQSSQFDGYCEELKSVNGVGLVYGQSGSGKTASVELYCRKYGATVYIELNRWERTACEVERLLCEQLDPGDRQRGRKPRALWLVEHLKDTGRLIIVDDADEATYDALKWLFDFNDVASVPVMLVGNEDVLKIVRRNPKMFSRLKLYESLEVPSGKALRNQVGALLDAIVPDHREVLLDMAVAIAERHHGGHLRAVQARLLKMQAIMAKASARGSASEELTDPVNAFQVADRRLPEPGLSLEPKARR